jgi:2-alkyl-3-oxoalkanoate reductase
MKIVITGASGFIGGALCAKLAKIPEVEIIAVGRSKVSNKFDQYPSIQYSSIDLATFTDKMIDCDVCIHCAGLASDTASKEDYERDNIIATRNILHAVESCHTFIYISSSSVYDFTDGLPKKEGDARLDSNISEYGRSKLLAEQEVLSSKIPSKYILRPRAVYGKGDRVLMPRILAMIRDDRMFIPNVKGVKTSLTSIHLIEDIVTYIIHKQQAGCHVYNIADTQTYSLWDVLSAAGKVYKKDNLTIVAIPKLIVYLAMYLSKIVKTKVVLSRQAIHYLFQNSTLDISKATRDFSLPTNYYFYDLLETYFSDRDTE